MRATSKQRFIRISPLKVRRVARVIEGMHVNEALDALKFMPQKGAEILHNILNAAKANALHHKGGNEDDLFIEAATVDQGPSYKRVKPRARGMRDVIKKKTSHVTVVIGDGKGE